MLHIYSEPASIEYLSIALLSESFWTCWAQNRIPQYTQIVQILEPGVRKNILVNEI